MYIFDQQDHMIKKFGSDGQRTHASGVCFDNNNFLYVAEQKGHRVQKFYLDDGYFILKFGGLGEHEGNMYQPIGIIARNDKVYVADQFIHRISVYHSTSSDYCFSFGSCGMALASFNSPGALLSPLTTV